MSTRTVVRVAAATAVVSLLACGGPPGSTAPPSGPRTPPTSPTVAAVVVTPTGLSLNAGTSARLAADPRDQGGAAVPGARVTWSSAAPTVARVADDGMVTAIAPGQATITASAGGRQGSASVTVVAVHDLDGLGVPTIIARDYIDLAKIGRISRFRSGIGHDYADDAERCRSMKHYFQPRGDVDWGSVVIASPVDGTIAEVQRETTFGDQVRIAPTAAPAATVILFHVRLDAGIGAGSAVRAGQRLGAHIGSQTMSDVAIFLDTPKGRRLVSYFDAMPDSVFAAYQARGVASRAPLVISRAERDASPLSCDGERFLDAGAVANWVDLR